MAARGGLLLLGGTRTKSTSATESPDGRIVSGIGSGVAIGVGTVTGFQVTTASVWSEALATPTMLSNRLAATTNQQMLRTLEYRRKFMGDLRDPLSDICDAIFPHRYFKDGSRPFGSKRPLLVLEIGVAFPANLFRACRFDSVGLGKFVK